MGERLLEKRGALEAGSTVVGLPSSRLAQGLFVARVVMG